MHVDALCAQCQHSLDKQHSDAVRPVDSASVSFASLPWLLTSITRFYASCTMVQPRTGPSIDANGQHGSERITQSRQYSVVPIIGHLPASRSILGIIFRLSSLLFLPLLSPSCLLSLFSVSCLSLVLHSFFPILIESVKH